MTIPPLHLLSLLLLLLLLTHPLTVTATPTFHPTCNEPSEPPIYVPAVFSDCIVIVNLISTVHPHHDPSVPLKWAEDESLHPDFELPARWRSTRRKCIVDLDLLPSKTGSDRSNLDDLAAAAKAVALKCVIQPPHLGGWVAVGWERKMRLEVARLVVERVPRLSVAAGDEKGGGRGNGTGRGDTA